MKRRLRLDYSLTSQTIAMSLRRSSRLFVVLDTVYLPSPGKLICRELPVESPSAPMTVAK